MQFSGYLFDLMLLAENPNRSILCLPPLTEYL